MSDFDKQWAQKQELAKPGRFYGGAGTIHSTTVLDVETDAKGRVVAVWYRCQMLPFRQSPADPQRADHMRAAYEREMPKLTGVEVVDP